MPVKYNFRYTIWWNWLSLILIHKQTLAKAIYFSHCNTIWKNCNYTNFSGSSFLRVIFFCFEKVSKQWLYIGLYYVMNALVETLLKRNWGKFWFIYFSYAHKNKTLAFIYLVIKICFRNHSKATLKNATSWPYIDSKRCVESIIRNDLLQAMIF